MKKKTLKSLNAYNQLPTRTIVNFTFPILSLGAIKSRRICVIRQLVKFSHQRALDDDGIGLDILSTEEENRRGSNRSSFVSRLRYLYFSSDKMARGDS